jgi:acyl dehydratase
MRSRPHIGIVTLNHELENQRGEIVLRSRNSIMFRRRDTSETGDAA